MNEVEKIKQYRLQQIQEEIEKRGVATQFLFGDKYTLQEQGWLQFLKPEEFTPTQMIQISRIKLNEIII